MSDSNYIILKNGVGITPWTDRDTAVEFSHLQGFKDGHTYCVFEIPNVSKAGLYLVREVLSDVVLDTNGIVANHPWTLAAERRKKREKALGYHLLKSADDLAYRHGLARQSLLSLLGDPACRILLRSAEIDEVILAAFLDCTCMSSIWVEHVAT